MNEFSKIIEFDSQTDFHEAVEFVQLIRNLHEGEETDINEIEETFKKAFSKTLKGNSNMPNFQIEDGEFTITINKEGSQAHNLARFLKFHGFNKIDNEIKTMKWSL